MSTNCSKLSIFVRVVHSSCLVLRIDSNQKKNPVCLFSCVTVLCMFVDLSDLKKFAVCSEKTVCHHCLSVLTLYFSCCSFSEVIGDEILKGHVADANSHYLCRQLWHLGINVSKVCSLDSVVMHVQGVWCLLSWCTVVMSLTMSSWPLTMCRSW